MSWETNRDLKVTEQKLAALSEERSKLFARMRAGERDPGCEERLENLDRAIGRLSDLRDELEQEPAREARIRELAKNPANREEIYDEPEGRRAERNPARDEALRTIERKTGHLASEAADSLDELVRRRDPHSLAARYIAAVGDPNYASAFGRLVMDPMTGHLKMSREELEAIRRVADVERERAFFDRGMSLTGASGGFAVPFELDPSLMLSSAGVVNPLRQIARVTPIAVDEWRGVTSAGVTASFAAEATEVGDNSPTLAQPTISTEKAHAFVPFTIELGMDWPSLQQELAVLFSDAKETLEATKFLLGTGVAEPGGILNIGSTGGLTTTQRVQTDVIATLDIDDVWDLKGQLASTRFFANSIFVGNPGMLDRIFRFTPAGSTTEPQAYPDRAGPLMGRPVRELSTMVNTTTTGSRVLILGDFRNFRIVDRIGLTIELVPHLLGANRRPSGERGLYMYWRVGTGAVVPSAFRYLEVL